MTLITEFYDPVRAFLGDHDDQFRLYEDAAIARGVRTVVRCGMVSGYALSGDSASITPDVTGSAEDFLRITLRVALMFASAVPSRQSTRTRAFSESVGSYTELVSQLEMLLHNIENGNLAGGWQSFSGFVAGYEGLRHSWGWLTRLKMTGPWSSVTIGEGGAVVD